MFPRSLVPWPIVGDRETVLWGEKPVFSSPLRSQFVQLLFESQPGQFPRSHRDYDLVLRGGRRLYVGAVLLSAAQRLKCQLQVSWYFHFCPFIHAKPAQDHMGARPVQFANGFLFNPRPVPCRRDSRGTGTGGLTEVWRAKIRVGAGAAAEHLTHTAAASAPVPCLRR